MLNSRVEAPGGEVNFEVIAPKVGVGVTLTKLEGDIPSTSNLRKRILARNKTNFGWETGHGKKRVHKINTFIIIRVDHDEHQLSTGHLIANSKK